ncbi:hypothetical protein OROGR_018419 [Orobanche gracilis]
MALDLQTIFLYDVVHALYDVGKEIYLLRGTIIEEMTWLNWEVSNVIEAFRVVPIVLKRAPADLQDRHEKILKEEKAKMRICEAKNVYALQETRDQLKDHDKKIKDVALVLQNLVEKVTSLETKRTEIVNLLINIDTKVTSLDDAKNGEESRKDNITAAINILVDPSHSYKVSKIRPKFYDPSVPWKNNIQKPNVIELPTYRQPTAGEVKKWRKNEVMRYFVVLIRESALLNSCKTMVEAAQKFAKMLEEGRLPLQLLMKRKHQKGEPITHSEDLILSYDKSHEGRAFY